MAETCVRVRVGAEEYALPVAHVPEIAELGEITPVPGAPAQVIGIRNVRGEILPVFDLASALSAAGDTAPTRIALADAGGRRCALAVDAVVEVSDVEASPEGVDSPLLLGAAMVDGRLIGVVDVPALLDALAPDGGG